MEYSFRLGRMTLCNDSDYINNHRGIHLLFVSTKVIAQADIYQYGYYVL